MHQSFRLLPKCLSPYAQALKHIAIRGGREALGPSAKECELELYQNGLLPADYRPMVNGKWDDSIERWAHAWQFPEPDAFSEESRDLLQQVSSNRQSMQQLLHFGQRLIQRPPSPLPPVSSSPPSNQVTAGIGEETKVFNDSAPSFLALEATVGALPPSLLSSSPASSPEVLYKAGVPLAYIDNGSEQAAASKELCAILEDAGLDYTEDGLLVAIGAMSSAGKSSSSLTGYFSAARAIFNWVGSLGLGPNAEMYKALMRHTSCAGNVHESMVLIEEMKDRGITPTIGIWHEMMRTFHAAKDYSSVARIVDHMKMYANIEPNEVTFVLQLRALAKSHTTDFNALSEAVQLFDQMTQVYGYLPSRPHYDALMFALSQSPAPEMRLHCEELARKMELMGLTWDRNTFMYLIRSAQSAGDVEAVERYLGKMRDMGVPVSILHLAWSIQAYVQLVVKEFHEHNDEGAGETLFKLTTKWQQYIETCFGVYRLVQQRGWEVQLPLLNALLHLCCQCTMLSLELRLQENVVENNLQGIVVHWFEHRAQKLWEESFQAEHLSKDEYSYECYIALLAYQQRVDEAETLFQKLILHHEEDDSIGAPTRRTYESLLLMHLTGGEEGGAARALHYLEAMERSGIPIRPSLLRKMVRVHHAAGYTRDMKRRARRIMEAREEYMSRKAEAEMGFPTASTTSTEDVEQTVDLECTPTQEKEAVGLSPPFNSTLAWWHEWERSTPSKHELFEEENPDGTPKGESFAEKDEALLKLGIDSPYKKPSDLPKSSLSNPSFLVSKIRKGEGEMMGSIWSLDGGDLSYPQDGGGPQGWGVRLWRERQLVKKEFDLVKEGQLPPPSLSEQGNAVRVASDQLDIEISGAETPGELSDWRKFEEHRYDDGKGKPASEMAVNPSVRKMLVWQAEANDPLTPYKTDEELAVSNDNTFYQQLEGEAAAKTTAVVQVLQDGMEHDTEVVGRGPTRRSKYDYLEKWREMYRHGTLDIRDLASPAAGSPHTPLLRFGRTPEDHKDTLAATVREWHARQKKTSGGDTNTLYEEESKHQLERWATEEAREKEARIAKQGAISGARRRSRRKKIKGKGDRFA